MDHGYQGKFDASDLVQQTLIEAWKSAEQFRGQTEAERMAWLRQILAHVLAHEVRRYFGTLKRNADREVSFEESLEQSSRRWQGFCDSAMSSPSQHVMRQEQNVQLAEALEQLPDDYREVIVLRHLEGLSHEEVAHADGPDPGCHPHVVDACVGRTEETVCRGQLCPVGSILMIFHRSRF